ncbi:hypothetical protein B0T14DRAFT_571616 [Immersiella caudata]|uniref:Nephrocystin 3-like N-terminal domain-containing protein n=1 Tax=Immersiella caudata TaxID=314043 RepID=A0AA39THR5_9PEZI|nr:hypothetical protein B0T14DRAFT_571616 [Immersiella caudata]
MTGLQHDGAGQQLWVSVRDNVQRGSGTQINGSIAQLSQYITQTGSKEAEYLRDLYITDPRYDKQRLESAAGGVLSVACKWILDQATFQNWRDDPDSNLLWIKGGPGTGKTMAFGYIIDQLVGGKGEGDLFAYFFCEQGNRDADNASAVLRGLCYMLITRWDNPDTTLLDIVEKVFDTTGVRSFDGPGAWFRLEKIFRRMLEHLSKSGEGGTIHLFVDALNACGENLQNLLKLIVDTADSKDTPRVKWLVTGHRGSNISRILNIGGTDTRHSMDVDDYPKEMMDAVDAFIDDRTERIAASHRGVDVVEVRELLRGKVGKRHSFLYTALLVASTHKARDREELLDILEKAAQDITGLYEETVSRIHDLEDDDVRRGCLDALGAVAAAYGPLYYLELRTLVTIKLNTTAERVRQECETFFVVNEDWEVQVVNQSARDFLRNSPLTPSLENQHRRLFSQSLKAMQRQLHRDMCQVIHPGYAAVDLKPEHHGLLVGVGYASEYWIEHFIASGKDSLEPRDVEAVHAFLKDKFLNWVEVMSLLGNGRDALLSWSKLVNFLQGASSVDGLIEFVKDARRFLEFNAESIFTHPLQVYASALVFAPTNSTIKGLFAEQYEPSWVSIGSGMERPHWSLWTRTLNPKTKGVAVAKPPCFSPDGTWVAALMERQDDLSERRYSEVAVWDLETVTCMWTLPGATGCVGFPNMTSRLAVTMDGNMEFWDLIQGCWDTSKHIKDLSTACAAFSSDGIWLAAATGESHTEVEIWDWARRDYVLSVGREGDFVPAITSIAFSASGSWLATADGDSVCVWSHESGDCLWTIGTSATAVGFSKSPEDFVLAAGWDMVTTWDWQGKRQARKLFVEKNSSLRESLNPVALSADGSRFAVAKTSMTRVWDATTRRRIQELSGYDEVHVASFSPDGSQLALGDVWGLKICDTTSSDLKEIREDKCHRGKIKWIKALDGGRKVASVSVDAVIVWETRTGRQVSKLEPEVEIEPQEGYDDDDLLDVSFSSDGSCVVIIHRHRNPTVWNIETGEMSDPIPEAAARACVSPDGKRAVIVDFEDSVKVWNLEDCRFDRDKMDYGPGSPAECVAFAPKSDLIAVSSGGEVATWVLSGRRWKQDQTVTDTGSGTITSLCFSSDGTHLVGSTENESIIWYVSSGDLLGSVDGLGPGINVVGFNAYSPFIQTSLGLFVTNDAGVDSELRWGGTFDLRKLRHQGFGLDADMSWITWGSHRVLWLPPEYRPNSMAVLPVEKSRHMESSLIALGCRSGRVVFLRFPRNASPLAPARERSSEDNL